MRFSAGVIPAGYFSRGGDAQPGGSTMVEKKNEPQPAADNKKQPYEAPQVESIQLSQEAAEALT